jgi:hypothetical protein
VGRAGADEFYVQSAFFDRTFTAADGRAVTCRVSGSSSLFRSTGEPAFEGSAATDTFGGDPACDGHFVQVEVSYDDVGGNRRRTGASSVEGSVFWFGDDVGSGPSAQHLVVYFDCQTDCEVVFATSPK